MTHDGDDATVRPRAACWYVDFTDFYTDSYPRLLRAAVAVTADRAAGEDVLQEAFVRASRRWDDVRHMDSPEAWVRRVVVNAAKDHVRGRRRRQAAESRLSPGADVHLDGSTLEVLEALRQLPLAQRQALVLNAVVGLALPEVARELDRPLSTVKSQVARGRARLAHLLALDPQESS